MSPSNRKRNFKNSDVSNKNKCNCKRNNRNENACDEVDFNKSSLEKENRPPIQQPSHHYPNPQDDFGYLSPYEKKKGRANVKNGLDVNRLFWRTRIANADILAATMIEDRKRVAAQSEENNELWRQACSGQVDFSNPFWEDLRYMTCQKGLLFNHSFLCANCLGTDKGGTLVHGISVWYQADSRICPMCLRLVFKMVHADNCQVCVYSFYFYKAKIKAGYWHRHEKNAYKH